MLALHLAEYRLRFGVVERRDLLELVGATDLTDEQTQLLKDGMQLLVGYLVRCGPGGTTRMRRFTRTGARVTVSPKWTVNAAIDPKRTDTI